MGCVIEGKGLGFRGLGFRGLVTAIENGMLDRRKGFRV